MKPRSFLFPAAFFAAACLAQENPYGVCAHVTMGEKNVRGRIFHDASDAGIGWIRTCFRFWMVREYEKDPEDWSLFENTLSDADAAGLRILPIFWRIPHFQRPILQNRDVWRAWVRRATERLGGRFDAVEIGNEPNVAGFWSEPVFRMDDYVALLRDAWEEIKAVRPDIRVSCAGWAGIPLDRIAEFYARGGAKFCDIMSVHPYCDHEYENRPEGFLDTGLEALRDLMAKNGDGDKPVWLTEIGWPTHRQTLGGASVLGAGLKAADPKREAWRVVVVGRSPDDGTVDATYVSELEKALPAGSSVEPVLPEALAGRIAQGSVDAVVFTTGKEFHREAFPAFRKYVANGGTGIILAHQAMRDEMERCPDGSVKRVEGGWGIAERAALHFESVMPWDDKSGTTPFALAVRQPNDPEGKTMTAKGYVGTRFLKGNDRFVPLASGEHGGRVLHAAGLYVFDSDLTGKLLVSTLHDPFFRASSEARQAKMLVRSLAIAFAEGVEKVFWYCYADTGPDGPVSDSQARFGIARTGGEAKPALRAYATFAKMRPPGSVRLGDPWQDEARTVYFPKWVRPDGRTAGAIWTIGSARELFVPLDGSDAEFFDMYGSATAAKRTDGGFLVETSDSPVYFLVAK